MLGAKEIRLLEAQYAALTSKSPSTESGGDMQPFRPVLVVYVAVSSVFPKCFSISADVQIWRGKVCVTTIRIHHSIEYPMPNDFDPSCVEQYAAMASRIAARLIDEDLYLAIADKSLHTWHDLDRQFPPLPILPE